MKLPKDWKMEPLSKVIDPNRPIAYGVVQTGEPVDNGVPCVRVVDLTGRKLDRRDMITTTEEISKSYKRTILRSGDVIMALRGEIGKAALVDEKLEGINLTRGVALLSVNLNKVDPRFTYQVLGSEYVQREIQHGVNGTGLKEIPIGNLRKVAIPVPPLPEQRKIADILSTWDEALETLDALIAAKIRQKQALMQQLLTGKTRVKGAKGKWKKVRFGDWLTESRIPGTDGSNAKKITVKLYGRGVYSKQDRLGGSENTKYYVRKSGQFIYSKLDFLNGAFGIVPASLDGYESTLDLPSFDVSPSADARWLLYYVTRQEFYTQQLGAAAGGRKARRVNPSEFLAMKILAPDLTEQKQIAAILDTADQELTLLRTQRQTLDQQKRGLMQRLLTGKIRVKTP